MGKYAKNTCVSSEKSRAEIERTLARYGATGFMYGWKNGEAIIAFELMNRRITFNLSLPDRNSREFTHTEAKDTERSSSAAEAAYEQAVRRKWRGLALSIKAKLVTVDDGIDIFENEFMAKIMLPNGQNVGNFMRPQIDIAYKSGKMPALLPLANQSE